MADKKTIKIYLAFTEGDELLEWIQSKQDVDNGGLTVRISASEVVRSCVRQVMTNSE